MSRNSGTTNTKMCRNPPLESPISAPDVTDKWDLLKMAVQHHIQNTNTSSYYFEELYRIAFNMAVAKKGEKLYNGVRDVVTYHLKNKVREDVMASLNNNFLQKLNAAWVDHQSCMKRILDFIMYLDKTFLKPQNKFDNVYDLGLKIFRDEVIRPKYIREHLQEVLLDLVARERRGEMVDRTALQSACVMLTTVSLNSRDVYEEEFEQAFLQHSTEFYRLESKQFLAENSTPVYINKVEARIAEEVERARHYLDPKTEPAIVTVLAQELIQEHMTTLVDMENSGAVHMLKNDQQPELYCVYKLFARVSNGLETLRDCVSVYLRETGKSLMEDCSQKSGVEYIQSLLDLKDRMDEFLDWSFQNDPFFSKMICNDFEWFLNLNNKSPEFLSLFIADKLKKGVKMLSEQEVQVVIEKSMTLFRFLREKDIFEKYYKQHLSRRLLANKSISDDLEKIMITKIKNECGCQFTCKLEGMVNDLQVSTTTNEEFKRHIQDNSLQMSGVDLSVQVLTTGRWPNNASTQNCNLPYSAGLAFSLFKQFYLDKHKGRKLSLQFSRGTADLNAYFYSVAKPKQLENDESGPTAPKQSKLATERRHILQVTTYQMTVLMLFNEREQWTFEELQQETTIPDKDLSHALQSLACGKPSQRVLVKEPKDKEINKSDQFGVNDSFTSKLHRVKIQSVSRKQGESEPEREKTRSKVENDRRHEIDATIVRIMKLKKEMNHTLLMAAVVQELSYRFHPIPQNIKLRIEGLIERGYLERLRDTQNVYRYIA